MANITIENVDIGSVVLEGADFRDYVLTFAGADTFVGGTILARQEVATAITPAADGGNTGDGTVTLATVVAGPAVPLAGAYVLTCIEAVTNGGIFNLADPNGAIVAAYLQMTAGAGAATVFEAAGLQFTVTDGLTDFAAGDFFTLTVAADGTLVPFATDGAGGAQVPRAILTYDVAKTGAGTEAIRAAVCGKYRKERLVIDADGDASTVDDAVIDQLRVYGLTPIDVDELNILDNQ